MKYSEYLFHLASQHPKRLHYNRYLVHQDHMIDLTLTLPGSSAGVSGSLDSYCSLKPLCSGMVEVVPARTSPTLLPHPLALCCNYPVSKCPSASIVMTSTVRVNIKELKINWLHVIHLLNSYSASHDN